MATLSGIPQNAYITTGNGQNCLNWDIVAGATSYSVQRSPDGVTFSVLATPTVSFYVDTTCVVGTQYWYRIASVSVAGTSGYQAYGTNGLVLSIVPCLPGKIPLGYLRQQAKLRADKLKSQFVTNDEWNFNINQSCFELYDLVRSKYGENWFLAPALLITLIGLDHYPLPDGSNYDGAPACLSLEGVDVNISGQSTSPNAGWVPLARANWSDRDRYTTFPGQAGALNNLYQLSYRPMGSDVFLFPPSTNQVIRLWYVPIMEQLLLDTDMLPFSISGWSEYVIVDAAIRALQKEESFEQANVLMGNKQQLIARIEYAAQNRDVSAPNSVQNTRATVGDPGFSGWGMGGGGGFGGGWGGGGW